MSKSLWVATAGVVLWVFGGVTHLDAVGGVGTMVVLVALVTWAVRKIRAAAALRRAAYEAIVADHISRRPGA